MKRLLGAVLVVMVLASTASAQWVETFTFTTNCQVMPFGGQWSVEVDYIGAPSVDEYGMPVYYEFGFGDPSGAFVTFGGTGCTGPAGTVSWTFTPDPADFVEINGVLGHPITMFRRGITPPPVQKPYVQGVETKILVL